MGKNIYLHKVNQSELALTGNETAIDWERDGSGLRKLFQVAKF